MAKIALITGITGQDGSYLAELLLAKGYHVHGTLRHSNSPSIERISHLLPRLQLHEADLSVQTPLVDLIRDVGPCEIFNLAAQSFVPSSWGRPIQTGNVTGLGVLRLLEAIRQFDPSIRFYQASSSEIFGKVHESPQNESTPLAPRTPYGSAKAYAHFVTLNYREKYNLFACSGILFNHESPRRAVQFVTRKITDGVARIKTGLADELRLGNLDSKHDWGFAGDYVEAMWLMLQHQRADDYVIGTGKTHSVGEFVEVAFAHAGLNWHKYVIVDPKFYRPAEGALLVSDPSRARNQLGWNPKVGFEELVKIMVDGDLARIRASLDNQTKSA